MDYITVIGTTYSRSESVSGPSRRPTDGTVYQSEDAAASNGSFAEFDNRGFVANTRLLNPERWG